MAEAAVSQRSRVTMKDHHLIHAAQNRREIKYKNLMPQRSRKYTKSTSATSSHSADSYSSVARGVDIRACGSVSGVTSCL
ncbi:hypothetical protein LSAT2_006363 [Lamellibrachia satsuma]|nr:hypothetical protein LSAT2_006363 [Lamellibrachia satsuma]